MAEIVSDSPWVSVRWRTAKGSILCTACQIGLRRMACISELVFILNTSCRVSDRPLQGKLYNFHKKKVGAPSGNENASNQSGKSCHIVKTSQQIAAQTGTSEKTVRNNGKFAEAVEMLGIESDIMAGTELPPPKKIMRQKVRLQF